MHRIQVQLKHQQDNSYEIHIEKGFFKRISSDLRMMRLAEQYVVISDTKVNRLYGKTLIDALKRDKSFLGKIVVPAGEQSKSFEQFQAVQEKMVSLGANRKTGVIALGGGVVGDLAGFVAASFMRGVPLIQIPTTLLAMVDSSVGGKVGIDLPSGKNLVGAFWQPKKVYIDPEVLNTLTQKQWRAGLGEAVKYGAIKDRDLWNFFEAQLSVWTKDPEQFLPSDWKVIEEMIQRCVQIKADVVMRDEKEGNLRQILNYGHTFGHVIELMSEYKVLHGEAVATGMRMAAALAEEMRFMPTAEVEKQNALLDQLKIGKAKTKGLVTEFIKHMKKDKKAKGDIRVVLVSRLGRCYQDMGHYDVPVDEKVLKKVLKESQLIDDKKVVVEKPVSSWSSPSYTGSSYSSPSGYSTPTPSTTSVPTGETDLQRRLREMRERAEERRRMGGQSSSGGLSGGGFLPG